MLAWEKQLAVGRARELLGRRWASCSTSAGMSGPACRRPAGMKGGAAASLRLAGSLLVLLILSVGCGYSVAARPPLPGGIEVLSVPVVENDTPEMEVGALMATALARRAEADGRLVASSEGEARLVGRIESIGASPVAFPAASAGAGMYALSMRARLRLLAPDGGSALSELTVTGREEYLAGRGPEETEANRRLALERLCDRMAEEAWSRLTAPR